MTPVPRVTGEPGPLPHFRAGAAFPSKLQQERSVTAWVAGVLAASRDVCKYHSLRQFGGAVVHGDGILG